MNSKIRIIFIVATLLVAPGLFNCSSEESNNPPATGKAITEFYFSLGSIATGIIDENTKTIAVTVPFGTSVTNLVAYFTATGTNVTVNGVTQERGITINDFTSSITYTVNASDGTAVNYIVTVTVALNDAREITAFSIAGHNSVINESASPKTITLYQPAGTSRTSLIATFSTTGSSVSVNSVNQNSGSTVNDFTSTVTYRVTAADGTTADYEVTVALCSSGCGDCDNDASTACENTNLNEDVNNCGSCNNVCSPANATGICTAGACGIYSCTNPWRNCDGKVPNGCEINSYTDIANCGGCAKACGCKNCIPNCNMGSCGIDSCKAGWYNKNGNPSDGCESNVP